MLIMDWKEDRRPIGWTAQHCPKCGRLEAFAGYDRVLVTRAFFVPIGGRSLGRMLVCDFCSATLAPPEDADLGLAEEKMSLERSAEPPTRSALEAMLRTLDESARTGDQEIMRGVWAGGLSGVVAGAVAGFLVGLMGVSVAPGPVDQQFIPFGLFGAMTGLVVGAIVEAQRQRRQAIDQVLDRAMGKHRLRTPTLRAVAQRMQPPVPRAIRALAEYEL